MVSANVLGDQSNAEKEGAGQEDEQRESPGPVLFDLVEQLQHSCGSAPNYLMQGGASKDARHDYQS